MLHTLQKLWGKWLCVGLNLRLNISELKLKPTSNSTKSIKTFVVSYTKGKEENMMRPFLSDKNTVFSQISIQKNNWIISDDFNLSEEFNIFFEDAARSLNVKPDGFYLSDTNNLSAPVEYAIKKFENHPSVEAIKQNVSVNQKFYFFNTKVLRDILKETTALNNKKNNTFGNIPTKLLKEVSDICAPALNDIWNKEIIPQKGFANNVKLADVTPAFKNEAASLLRNYRPVRFLRVVPKIFEKTIKKQILEYTDKYLSPPLMWI